MDRRSPSPDQAGQPHPVVITKSHTGNFGFLRLFWGHFWLWHFLDTFWRFWTFLDKSTIWEQVSILDNFGLFLYKLDILWKKWFKLFRHVWIFRTILYFLNILWKCELILDYLDNFWLFGHVRRVQTIWIFLTLQQLFCTFLYDWTFWYFWTLWTL